MPAPAIRPVSAGRPRSPACSRSWTVMRLIVARRVDSRALDAAFVRVRSVSRSLAAAHPAQPPVIRPVQRRLATLDEVHLAADQQLTAGVLDQRDRAHPGGAGALV